MTDQPTKLQLADGTWYDIPHGEPGSWPWVQEANWLAAAYAKNQDNANAYRWKQEYTKRLGAWQRVQEGADLEAIISAGSWLDGPQAVAMWTVRTIDEIKDVLITAGHTANTILGLSPWLVFGILGVIAYGFYKGTFKLRI